MLALVLSPLALAIPGSVPAADVTFTFEGPGKSLRDQAERLERLGDWGAAAEKYDELLRLDRRQTAVRERFQYCLRRYCQVTRLRDSSYRKEVLSLKYPQAVRLYEMVLQNLLQQSLEKDRVTPGILFKSGLEEFGYALSGPEFCFDHLGGMRPEQTLALRTKLQTQYAGRKRMTFEEAVESMREVVMKAANHYPNINPATVVMEFLCGACLALDDYTTYLTPRQLRELCAALKGRSVGVGLRLRSHEHKILIADVLPESPAGESMPLLLRDDHITAIDGKSTMTMAPETVADLLEGDEGTTVDLEIISPANGTHIVTLRRRALFTPSITLRRVVGSVGYLKVHCFQETTLHEFDQQMGELLKADCKSLILDLRGNPGGLFDVAVDIARRFLPEGIIVTTQQQDAKSRKVYRAENGMPLTMPLVVLVDGDTASAAEVLAGALKENHRARLVGQTTYGKGCLQHFLVLPGEGELRLPNVPAVGAGTGGIRITVARFYSPTGQPYTGRGVDPHVFSETDLQLDQARLEAQRLLTD
jgi:carboxyl-terminal processing protease